MTIPISISIRINFIDEFKKIINSFRERHLNPEKINPVLEPMSRCDGLIAFVSLGPGKSSAKAAIDFHTHGADNLSVPKLRHIWLLHSPASKESAKELREYAEKQNIMCNLLTLDLTNDVHNMARVKERIDDIANQALLEGINHKDIAIDITGGTVAVSLGFFMASLIYNFKVQIMIPNETDQDGRAIPEKGAKAFAIGLYTDTRR